MGHLEIGSTDQTKGMTPVLEGVRPEPRRPAFNHRSLRGRGWTCPIFADGLQLRWSSAVDMAEVPIPRKRPGGLVPCGGAWHHTRMRFRHAGLRRYWERDDASRLNPDHVARIGILLDDLAAADRPAQMDLPGSRLHQLVGNRRGTWSVRVSGNWRLTFRFEAGEAVDINLEDYH